MARLNKISRYIMTTFDLWQVVRHVEEKVDCVEEESKVNAPNHQFIPLR